MRRQVHGFFNAYFFMVGVLGSRKACRILDPVVQPDTSTALSLDASGGSNLITVKEAVMPNSILTISDKPIRQDNDNRYCLNDLHKAAGGNKKHRPSYFLANKQTKELIKEISIAGIPAFARTSGVGTFAIKELVYAYAMWISASFSLKVIRAYDSFVSTQKPELTLDDFIPKEDEEIASSLESLLYRSHKASLGVRALLWIDNGEATLVKQLTDTELVMDSMDIYPAMTAVANLSEHFYEMNQKYNIDMQILKSI